MRVIIAGGGTGGHLFPGVALAEELRARGGHEVIFVGTARGIEARVIPREGYALELIDVAGLKGGGVRGIVRGLLRVPRALLQSFAILRRVRPTLVVGVGGYASGPMVLAAALAGVPTAILEQNSVPGITNRVLGRVVRAIYAAFPGSARYFPARRISLLGNPIRAQLRAALAAHASDVAPAPGSARSILVLGGSQGAHPVNELVVAAAELLREAGLPLRLVHQTGRADRAAVAERYQSLGLDARAEEFIEDMAAAYAAADLVIARAGATTIAELTALGRAAILIPFPEAADDHQTMNARSLSDAGAALLLPQSSTTAADLAAAVRALLTDEQRRAQMAASARALGRPDAAATIVDALIRLAAR